MPKQQQRVVMRKRRRAGKAPRLSRDPHGWGLLAGTCAALLVLCIALSRQYFGAMLRPAELLIWALFAFVVSYGAAGCFALFSVRLAADDLRARKKHGGEAAPQAAPRAGAGPGPEQPPPAPGEDTPTGA